jgi:hypothetical protein
MIDAVRKVRGHQIQRSGMSGVSLPVTRPSGRALLVGNPATRTPVTESLARLGYTCGDADDPYAAMAELCRRPLAYRAVILSLASLYREELSIIRAIKRRVPHAEVWLTHTDGRQAALADAMRLGADGLLDDDGLHRIAVGSATLDDGVAREDSSSHTDQRNRSQAEEESASRDPYDADGPSDEPLLSAEELRALLQEQPSMPPSGEEES